MVQSGDHVDGISGNDQARRGLPAQAIMTSVADDVAATTSGLLTLPPEIREHVYKILLRSANARREPQNGQIGPYYKYDLNILGVNRLVNREAKKVFQDNVFVKVTTPWPEAISHVNSEGRVAVVLCGEQATNFQPFHLRVLIDTPEWHPHHLTSPNSYSMITTLEDLPAFTRIWYFSNLNNTRLLNPHLTLRLDLKNPHFPGHNVPKAMQSALLLPFGAVKDLHTCAFDFHGKPFFDACEIYPSIKKAVSDLQVQPTPSPEDCIEECVAHKTSANAFVAAKSYIEALQMYFKAFESIHIFISGRVREIHCDGYYAPVLTSGQYEGQNGHFVRMMLRVQLVANVVHTYIQLNEFGDAYFWGKRSILLFRRSMDGTAAIGDTRWDEWVKKSSEVSWGAKREMGKVFWRTGIARRQMGTEEGEKVDEDKGEVSAKEEVKALIWAASVYLPDDEIVKAEMQAMRLREFVGNRKKEMDLNRGSADE